MPILPVLPCRDVAAATNFPLAALYHQLGSSEQPPTSTRAAIFFLACCFAQDFSEFGLLSTDIFEKSGLSP